jgi:putative ABC transport system permease protein
MIKNYLKIAWRNLVKNKVHTVINVAGLSVGLACSLLIMYWIQDERAVDGFHTNSKQLYQVYERGTNDGKVEAGYETQGLLADELKKRVPEIEYATAFEQNQPHTFEANNKVIKMDGSYAGADFFSMFSYPLLQGAKHTALINPDGIAISRKMAQSFFGSAAAAMGKFIQYDNKTSLIVTAVFEDVPNNSSVKFEFLRSWKAYSAENAWVSSWNSSSPFTYVQLRRDADVGKVSAKINDFLSLYQPKTNTNHIKLLLQPYAEKYLNSIFKDGYIEGGRISYIRLFSIIGVFILLIACINFMNLATARSVKRAREVGVRKAVGAPRSALIGQFICEAMVLTFIAMVVAVILVIVLLPAFNNLTGKQLFIRAGEPLFWVTLLGLLAVTGLVSGSYPAFFLSSLNPVKVLKGNLVFSKGAAFFRKGLVVFQFTLAIILIIGTLVIYRQMQYIQNKKLGYNRGNLLYIPLEGDMLKNYELFKTEAANIAGVEAVSKMKESPSVITHSVNDLGWIGKDASQYISVADAVVGYDFVKTMKLQLAAGRDFSTEFADSASFIVNEAAVKRIGYKNAVGMPLWWGDKKGTIVGVVKDFHFNTMYRAIEPLVIRLAYNQKWGNIIVRVRCDKTRQAIAGLEKLSKNLNPNFTFSYQFANEEYARLYNSEQIISKLSGYFAGLAIFISCLGLLGLTIFVAEQRLKEIGIRKILGASVVSLFSLLSTEFLLLIVFALIVASPIAWLAISNWLQKFAYHTPVQWWMFALSGGLIIVIAMVTISFQTVKAAFANPVKSLRSE